MILTFTSYKQINNINCNWDKLSDLLVYCELIIYACVNFIAQLIKNIN